jgi:hypothetical protein
MISPAYTKDGRKRVWLTCADNCTRVDLQFLVDHAVIIRLAKTGMSIQTTAGPTFTLNEESTAAFQLRFQEDFGESPLQQLPKGKRPWEETAQA